MCSHAVYVHYLICVTKIELVKEIFPQGKTFAEIIFARAPLREQLIIFSILYVAKIQEILLDPITPVFSRKLSGYLG